MGEWCLTTLLSVTSEVVGPVMGWVNGGTASPAGSPSSFSHDTHAIATHVTRLDPLNGKAAEGSVRRQHRKIYCHRGISASDEK